MSKKTKKRINLKFSLEMELVKRSKPLLEDSLIIPFGEGKLVFQVELRGICTDTFLPRHQILVYRNDYGERRLSGVNDIIGLARFLGLSLEEQIKANPSDFAFLYNAFSTNAGCLPEGWVEKLNKPELDKKKLENPYVESPYLCYCLLLFEEDLKNFSIIKVELDIRTFISNTTLVGKGKITT